MLGWIGLLRFSTICGAELVDAEGQQHSTIRIPESFAELARGKPNLQPTYEQDFAGGSEPVTVVGDIQASGDAIKVSLKNPNMPPNGKIIDVTCWYSFVVLEFLVVSARS